MATLYIPREDIDALLVLANQSEEHKMYVLDIFSKYIKADSFKMLTTKLSEETDLSISEAYAIANVYFTLIRSKADKDYSNSELIENAVITARQMPEISEDEISSIEKILSALLDINNNDALVASMGAYQATLNGNTVNSFDFITELRPIISESKLLNLVLFNVLRIRYRSNEGEDQEAFFTFDKEDFESIAKAIEKAKERSIVIKSNLDDKIFDF